MPSSRLLALWILLSPKNYSRADDEAETCNAATPCWEGSFCNVEDEIGEDGTCAECDWHSYYCFESNLTAASVDNCFRSCYCLENEHAEAFLDVAGVDIDSLHFAGGFIGSASGSLVDVGLGTDDVSVYAGENDVSGSVCLIERGEISFYDKIANCQANGGIGAVIFNNEQGELNAVSYEDADTAIPSVAVGMEEGEELKSNGIGSTATLRLEPYTVPCPTECSVYTDCPANHFCNFDFKTHGYCESCTGYDESCYFSGIPLEGAQDCAEICGSSLTFDDCKLCNKAVTGDALSTATSESDVCEFCPSPYLDPTYDNVTVPMFGDSINCFLLDEFFTNYEISTQDKNCQIALMYNHLCGCEGGTGYAGANTAAKRETFVWLPRSTAIISSIGSLLIIIDIVRNRGKRKKMNNQLMLVLCVFDLIGSIAYSFTSLPTPKEDGIFGSQGNDVTCKVQGFFIQLGTTAAYINVSLAIYYLLVVKYKWSESKMKKYKFFFFGCPIAVGLAFACAGIPFYTNSILWCNNGARWWPEIPVIIAIIIATVTMAILCRDVYLTDLESSRFGVGVTQDHKMSKAVFWQSFWYLMVFYLTWPPYLALQYLWSSGEAYSMYGFVLFAGSLVTMQGFWNCVAFKRIEAMKQINQTVASIIAVRSRLSQSNANVDIVSTANEASKKKDSVNESAKGPSIDDIKDEKSKAQDGNQLA